MSESIKASSKHSTDIGKRLTMKQLDQEFEVNENYKENLKEVQETFREYMETIIKDCHRNGIKSILTLSRV